MLKLTKASNELASRSVYMCGFPKTMCRESNQRNESIFNARNTRFMCYHLQFDFLLFENYL